MQKKKNINIQLTREVLFNRLALMIMDALFVFSSMIGALFIRCDFRFDDIAPEFLETIHTYVWINVICSLLIFYVFHFYTSLWRFAGIEELKNIILGVSVSSALQIIGMHFILELPIPRSYPFIYTVLLLGFVFVSRFAYRFIQIYSDNIKNASRNDTRTMIIGAGAAGYMIVKEMKNSRHIHRNIVCIIDDNPKKVGTYLQGVPVMGRQEDIIRLAEEHQIQEIIIAIPTLPAAAKKELLQICQQTSCKILLLPGIYQLVNEDVTVSMLRKVEINDLLGREPVQLEMEEIMNYVKGKVVLVTGGGGSIGSEICRQIALHMPKQLIIFDIYENNAYDIQNELKHNYPELNLEVLIGSVRNEKRVDTIFEHYKPQLVFHAAAHKHVPLMEDSPNESVKNNILGTWNVVKAADQYHADKMVLISTDKAVNPTNIMGASKRVCEIIVQCYAQMSETKFAAVRFGNVLGSNGSVIPLFRKQIKEGGPVTVTHPEIIRYFMTIPEAVNLVLQCGALANGGDIFILDMGEPVKIVDLARQMIRLSGLTPDEDIEIKFTGLRPGEKLYEELLLNENNLVDTPNERIFVAHAPEISWSEKRSKIKKLIESAFNEEEDIREQVQQLVPEYHFTQK